jgi:hypothetical protein
MLFFGFTASILVPDSCSGQELFSWWRREMIEIDLVPGAWAEFEITELAEGERSFERLRCEVLDGGESEGNWIALSWPGQEEWFVLELTDPDSLRGGEILDGLLDLYRMLPGGAAAREDVAEVQNDRLLRRHFQDLFDDPRVESAALPDTILDGRSLPREWLRLTERREDRVKMGRGDVVYVQEVESLAETSTAVPLFGLLRSRTHIVLSSEGGGRDAPPPLITETSVVCAEFGHRSPPNGLPEAVRRSRSRP